MRLSPPPGGGRAAKPRAAGNRRSPGFRPARDSLVRMGAHAIAKGPHCAAVVEESASWNPFVTEDAMIIALLLSIAAVLFLCWLLFTLASLALPFFVAISVVLWAHQAGAGIAGVLVAGLSAGIATLVAGQLAFLFVRATWVRLVVGLIFAVKCQANADSDPILSLPFMLSDPSFDGVAKNSSRSSRGTTCS